MKFQRCVIAVGLSAILSACGGGGEGTPAPVPTPTPTPTPSPTPTPTPTPGGLIADPTLASTPVFRNISVHDPSVIKADDGSYYVFGSHLSSAKSSDLISWTRVADGVDNNNILFESYATQAAEGIAWTDGWVGSWAADVIQLADNNYYFYYNHCAENPSGNCVSRSYLGVAKSANIEGPYENVQLILKTGQRSGDGPGVDGDPYNGNIHPNAIDPDVFFDKEGRLWMVYGSYSGGIYIMELNAQTGLPLDTTSYGTKLTGGFYSAIEGPFMLYSPETDYYYLFTSYGGFAQADGYNLRVARSRNPDGPFVDATGQDILAASGGWDNIAPYGNKLMGGFNFKSELGLSGVDYGYMAPGHGSALIDDDGKYLLFLHTRFINRGEFHEVRTHQMFVTDDDWLVVSPHRYTPIEGDNIVDAQDVLGTYQFINHGKDINRTAKSSSYLTLDDVGAVSGELTGTYTLADNGSLIIQTATNTFTGVASWQWHEQEQMLTPTFSLLSERGSAVWGSKMPFVDYQQAVDAIAQSLSFPDVVTGNIVLPGSGILDASISWTSSNTDVISTDGTVTRPTIGQGDAHVTLTANITLQGISAQTSFDIIVRADSGTGLLAHFTFDDSLADSNNVFSDASVTGTTYNSSGGSAQYTAGVHGNALLFDGSSGVKLPGTLITSHQYTVSYWVYPTAETLHTTTFFGGKDDDSWLSYVPLSWDGNTLLWSNNNGSWFDGATGEKIPLNTWSHLAFSVDSGAITLYIDGVEKASATDFPDLFGGTGGDFLLGINYFSQDPLFEGRMDDLQIYDRALSATQIYAIFDQ